MARLKVRLRGRIITELPLDESREYIAGRKEGADIQLSNEKGISREHFRLSAVNGNWTVDTLSRFGEVVLGGEKTSQFTLEHGMVFLVPPYEFEFLMTSADAGVSAEAGAEENVTDQGSHPEERTIVGVAPSVPYIKVMDARGEPKELVRLDGGDAYLAGRDSQCAIHIRDQRVSRRQFEIRRSGAFYSIIDLGSVNGTLVNGNPISSQDPTPLKSGDSISVLDNFLYFELHDPNFRSRMDLVNLQPQPDVMNHLVANGDPAEGLPAPYDPVSSIPANYQAPENYPMQPWAPPPMDYSQQPPPPAALPAKKGFDFEKNRPKVILATLAIVAVVFAFSQQEKQAEGPPPGALMNDPLSKLTPDQKKLAKDTFNLAKSYYMQGKYEFARSELVKMQEIIISYEDSDNLMKLVDEAINIQQLQKKQEEMKRAKAEQDAKVQAKVNECRKIINPQLTRDQMESCLIEIIPLDPANAQIAELYAEAERMTDLRNADMANKAARQADIDKLRRIYSRAKEIDGKNKPLDAMDAYQRVVASSLPDPGGLRSVSRDRIDTIRRQVNSKTAAFQKEAQQYIDNNKLKDAIIALRKARAIDPMNNEIPGRIAELKGKLQERMMVIYQEGILEESFGNVEGERKDEEKSDGAPDGAKAKWKKILEEDISDGEYYKKAYIKLKKYGAVR